MNSFSDTAAAQCIPLVPAKVTEEITPSDEKIFKELVSLDITPEQRRRLLSPPVTYPRQRTVLAVHWHPEHVPMDINAGRIDATFPNREEELIIPTQHNVLMSYGDYTGVEVDCYASGFDQKVQLLMHFEKERVQNAPVLQEILDHTFKYRSSQFFEFMEVFTKPRQDRLAQAVNTTGVSDRLVYFVSVNVKKIQKLLEQNMDNVPVQAIKNKILPNFFDGLRPEYGDALINRVLLFLKEVKRIVKANFSLQYFYRASEVIEEARRFGAGIIIPHPEQFWPILLADYDVDGVEVWNPQSQRYTHFLVSILKEKNSRLKDKDRRLLAFMGDDTHMGEKTRDPKVQNPEKAGREIGVQPAWEDMKVKKNLIVSNFSRRRVIREYKERLAG